MRAGRTRLFRWTLAAAWAAVAVRGAGTPGQPALRDFDRKEMLARGPVVAFAVSTDNSLIVGSDCLSVFDGTRWRRIDVPNGRSFRALAPAPAFDSDRQLVGRVWVGGNGALGYLETDGTGAYHFFSLLPQLARTGVTLENAIWYVRAVGRSAWFVTSHAVLRWDGARVAAEPFPGRLRLRAFTGPADAFWLWHPDSGLWRYDAAGKTLLGSSAAMPPGQFSWVLPSATKAGAPPANALDGAWVGTDRGVWRRAASGWERAASLDAALRGRPAASAMALDQGKLAFATDDAGVVLTDPAGARAEVLDRRSGLRDDAIQALWFGPDQNLWIGLDDAFVRVTGLGRVAVFDAAATHTQGTFRKVAPDGDHLIAVTTKAIYRIDQADAADPKFTPLVAYHSGFADTADAPDGLWVGGVGGLWRVRNGQAGREWPTVDPVTRCCAAPPGESGVIFVEDSRVQWLTAGPAGTWTRVESGVHLPDLPASLMTDARGEIWLSTISGDIYRFRCDHGGAGGRPRLVPGPRGALLPPNTRHPVLVGLGSELFAFSDTGVLRELGGGRFDFLPGFQGWIGISSSALKSPVPTGYWMMQRAGLSDNAPYSLLRVRSGPNGAWNWETIRLVGGDQADEISSVDAVAGSGGLTLWIGQRHALVRLKEEAIEVTSSPLSARLRSVVVDRGERLALAPSAAPQLGPGPQRIGFEFAAARPVELGAVFFQTKLEGAETDWSTPTGRGAVQYTGLAPGAYVFQVRRVDRSGRTGPVTGYAFAVAAPWYRRWPAQTLAVVLLALLAGFFVRRRIQALQRQSARLNRLVAERTKELEMSNAAKGEFLETISHEIRNPLNGVVGLVSALEGGGVSCDDPNLVRSLKECAAELSSVFDEVLSFSRLESGAFETVASHFTISGLFSAVQAVFADPARQRGCSLSVELPPDFPDGFVGDFGKIRRILDNFVSNALKYAPGAPITLRCACLESGPGGCDLVLEVADHGPGVAEDEQELIFKKFVRGTAAHQSQSLGTGLGLATCRKLADKLGGSVGIESPTQGARGATFYLKLSLRRDTPPPPPPAFDEAQAGWALIVDDKVYNQIALAGILSQLGFRQEIAGSREQALEVLAARRFDAIFLDLDLRDGTGWEIARGIRSRPEGAAVVIIGTTGRAGSRSLRRCQEAGIDAMATKPLTRESIAAALASVSAASLSARGPLLRPAFGGQAARSTDATGDRFP